MVKECTIIIDPQADFISVDGNYAKRHPGMIQIMDAKEKINEWLHLRQVQNILVVVSDYSDNQFEENLSLCIPGTKGHKIDISVNESCILFTKRQHSAFSSFEFTAYLKSNNISKLLLCGFLAEYCVHATAIDALKRGYDVCLLEDCIGTGDDVQHKKTAMLEELERCGATITDSSTFCA
jgi:nicotinamidase/pyrazinamidase